MSNLFDKASKFKCDSGECGQETNNIAGLFFAQEVAHDTSDRNVKQIIGFYNRFFFFFSFLHHVKFRAIAFVHFSFYKKIDFVKNTQFCDRSEAHCCVHFLMSLFTSSLGNLTNGIRCCDWKHKAPLPQCAINPDCKTITVPKDDKFYAPLKIFCLNYVRMQSTLNIDCSVSNDNVMIVVF